jgi:hypothetical protein
MPPKIALALSTLALGTALAAVPTFAQTPNGPNSSAQQPQTPIGRAVNDGGPGYDPQNTANNGSAENQQPSRATGGAGPYRAGPNGYGGGNYFNFAPGLGYGAVAGPADQSAIGWCQARFRSFDPATGTFLGFDGVRHSCP